MPNPYNQAIADKIVAEALSHLGEHEIGNTNTGVFVDRLLAFVHLEPGNPWCAAFADDMVAEAGVANGPRTGSSGGNVEWAKQHYAIVADPRRGDLGCVIDATSDTGYRHTVMVEHNFNASNIQTIEGNHGNAVRRGVRGVQECTWFRPY